MKKEWIPYHNNISLLLLSCGPSISYNNQIQPPREDYVKMSKHKKQERQKNAYILYIIYANYFSDKNITYPQKLDTKRS